MQDCGTRVVVQQECLLLVQRNLVQFLAHRRIVIHNPHTLF